MADKGKQTDYHEHGGIKSKDRSRKYGEVFTPEWVVKKMVDMLEMESEDAFAVLTKTFLDPTVGTGNFPAEILRRKFAICETPLDGVVAISTIYGVDIQEDNILECRERLRQMYVERFGPAPEAVDLALERNFVAGNFLTRRLNTGEPIWFLREYLQEEAKNEKSSKSLGRGRRGRHCGDRGGESADAAGDHHGGNPQHHKDAAGRRGGGG